MKTTCYEIDAGLGKKSVFAFISDIHENNADKAYDLTVGAAPDAVLVAGDYIQNGKKFETGVGLLEELAKKHPVFCSLGNHEFKYGNGIRRLTADTGAVLLDDSDVLFNGIRIGGLTSGFDGKPQGTFRHTPEPDLEFLHRFACRPEYKILLSHHPEYYPAYIKDTGIQLTLSGHAHGGQWRFFGRGIFAPGQGLFPKYTSGMYDGRLIVSRGIGNSHPIPRINNDTEFILITLK